MKPHIRSISKQWCGLVAAFLGLLLAGHAQAQIYVSTSGGTIGEYNLDGSTVNASLITGVSTIVGVAISGSSVYTESTNGKIGKYTTSGATVNAALITDSYTPDTGIMVGGTHVYVLDAMGTNYGMIRDYSTDGTVLSSMLVMNTHGAGSFSHAILLGSDFFVSVLLNSKVSIDEYDITGAHLKISLITGLSDVADLAAWGTDLFIASSNGTVAEYDTTGALISSSLISGISGLNGIAVSGTNLFLTTSGGTVSEYDTLGNLINATLITGITGLNDIVVVVPEPSTWACVAIGGLGMMGMFRRGRRKA